MTETQCLAIYATMLNKVSANMKEGKSQVVIDTVSDSLIGTIDNTYNIYRAVYHIDDPSVIQKGAVCKVAEVPDGFVNVYNLHAVIRTYEDAYSCSDIVTYVNTTGVYAKQNFTGYPRELTVYLDYLVEV